jgi:anti-sigma regulatory factor (Ser/Thr protein kinase)
VTELFYDLPATSGAVDRVCREVEAALTARRLESERFPMAMLLREGLNNAVIHGSRTARAGRMRCRINFGHTWLQVVIEDDGPGFDWRARLDCRAGVDECHGRGLQIYQLYSDEVRFNRKGNRVHLRRRISRGNAHGDDSGPEE